MLQKEKQKLFPLDLLPSDKILHKYCIMKFYYVTELAGSRGNFQNFPKHKHKKNKMQKKKKICDAKLEQDSIVKRQVK